MSELLKQISDYGLVPVIKIDDVEKAVPLAKALCDGGLPVAEVTFRTACAAEAIEAMAKAYPDMIVGAGTVLTCEQADAAVKAGAKFIVSPGLNPKVVAHCVENNIPIVPGCANPSDIEAAISFGLNTVKFFPAEPAGGLNMLKAMSAPYGNIKFMPTGGINEENLNTYLKFDKIIACGGSFMVPTDLLNAGEFDKITELVKNAVQLVLGFELRHVGINCESREEAEKALKMIELMFGFKGQTPGKTAVFAGKEFELIYNPYLGKNGHIAIATNSMERAVAYFNRLGIKFKDGTAKYDEKGKLKAIYFEEEIAGFAFHLLRK